MGTMLQRHSLSPSDFGGHDGCLEMLNLTRPQLVTDVHRAYLAAGADAIETNTFGLTGLDDRLDELAEVGARLARQAADTASTPDHPRWVLGSVGPCAREQACRRQVAAMIRGGIDAVLIETGLDPPALEAQVHGAQQAAADAAVDLPVLVCVTTRPDGTLPLGDDLEHVVSALAPLGIDGFGINCAHGLTGLRDQLARLASAISLPLLCLPSAGLPTVTEHGLSYPIEPAEFARELADLARTFDLALAGGCCGTTPEHIAALVGMLAHRGF